MIQRTGAELIVELLERQGIDVVSGIPGGANLPLYDALARRGTIRHILARHEQGAGFIAQGMARVTGKPAVCLATSGPGLTNMLTAIADAKLDSIPLICIAGQVPLALIGTDAFQEVNTFGLTLPITKHNALVRSAAELLTVIPQAFQIAMSGRPGPVVIDVPKDVQTQTVEFEAWPEPGRASKAPAVSPRAIEQAAELMNAAKRPVLYIGGGVVSAQAQAEVRALAEKGNIPAAMTLMGLGVLPAAHPLALGMLGMHAARYTTAQAYPFHAPRRWLTSGGLGTMGFGLPAAIGASLAAPERTVICFSGDGSLLMNIQELATAVEVQANVKIILMNNNALGMVHQQQDMFYGRRIFAAAFPQALDFTQIARGFGMAAFDLGSSATPEALLAEAFRHQGPCLIHAPISVHEKVFPMVPPGAANRDMVA